MRIVHLPNWAELVSALDAPVPAFYAHGGKLRSSEKTAKDQTWDWNTGWKGSRAMAGSDGWPDGVSRIKRFSETFISELASRIHPPLYNPDVTGEFFDVGVLMTGEPEHWYQREDSPESISAAGRVYRIVLNLSASHLIDADSIARRGAAAAALIQLLDLAGFATELIAVATSKKNGSEFAVSVTLKHSGEALDLDRLALVAIHPAGLRRIFFRLYENLSTDYERVTNEIYTGGSYGKPVDVPADQQGDIYSPAMRGSDAGAFRDDRSASEWIENHLKTLGAI